MTTAADPLVLLERRDGVALLRLNRPQRHNSLVPALLEALLAALDEVEADTSVRAVVLTPRALLRWDADALAAGLERERAAFVAQISSAETADGMRRFLAGRTRE